MTGHAHGSETHCVLIVDDEQDILETLTELVEMVGCSAILASNGAEALAILSERRPCLMIVDLLMPVMSGNELLDAIKKQPGLAEVPVLISTSFPTAAPAGFPVVPKPIDINLIWDWMGRACRCPGHTMFLRQTEAELQRVRAVRSGCPAVEPWRGQSSIR